MAMEMMTDTSPNSDEVGIKIVSWHLQENLKHKKNRTVRAKRSKILIGAELKTEKNSKNETTMAGIKIKKLEIKVKTIQIAKAIKKAII